MPTAVARLDVNLFDSSVVADPFPVYERIRDAGRVVWNDSLKCWMVPGFDDCTVVLTDAGGRFSPMNGDPELISWFDAPNMMMVDGAEHVRLRRGLVPLFTRQAVGRWEQRVGEVVDELLAPLIEGSDDFDLIADFTMIPTVIVAEMLGVPPERHQDFRRWSHQIVSNLSFGNENPGSRAAMRQAGDEVNAYLEEEIERRRRAPQNDLLGEMLKMSDLTGGEVRSAAVLLLLAGYDTTAKLMANCLVVLADHPDQRQLVVEDLSRVPAAIEEVLRWAGVSQMTPRRAVVDTVLAGTGVHAGDPVYVLHGAANRDPARWPDPPRFDVDREQKSHHGFGFGPHLCLGAPLARLETKVALERLLTMAPEYRLRGVEQGKSMFARGPDRGVVDVAQPVAERPG
jgi:cytochrome P450